MPSRDLNDLRPDFKQRVLEVLSACQSRGVDMLVYCTLRTEQEQAMLFRQNRPKSKVMAKHDSLIKRGFPQLAQILIDVGPQPGRRGKPVTFAGPGESPHQHGIAIDAVPTVNGKLVWNYQSNEEKKLWNIYHEEARRFGLEPLSWERVHIQLAGFNDKNSPIYKDVMMAEKYA